MWLSEKFLNGELDLTGSNFNFDHQKFSSGTDFAIFKSEKNKTDFISFKRADLRNANLTGAHLRRANFSSAKNLTGANFEHAFYEKDRKPKNIDFEELGYILKEETLTILKIETFP